MNYFRENLIPKSRTSSLSSLNSNSGTRIPSIDTLANVSKRIMIKVKLFGNTNTILEYCIDGPCPGQQQSTDSIDNQGVAGSESTSGETMAQKSGLKFAEDVVIGICKHLKMKPLSRYVMALYQSDLKVWLAPNQVLSEWPENCRNFLLKIRFKPTNLDNLRNDKKFMDYFFHQMRAEFLVQKKFDSSMIGNYIGIAIADALRCKLEQEFPLEDTFQHIDFEKCLPKYLPQKKLIIVTRMQDIKRQLHDTLHTSRGNINLVKEEYIKDIMNLILPNYFTESFDALYGTKDDAVRIEFRPYEISFLRGSDGVYRTINTSKMSVDTSKMSDVTGKFSNCLLFKSKHSSKDDYALLCTISDISNVIITTTDGATGTNLIAKIIRYHGSTIEYKFSNIFQFKSFLCLLESYYTLSENAHMSICKSVLSPSMTKFEKLKCYGPIGSNFTRQKLESKSDSWYTLRLDDDNFDTIIIETLKDERLLSETILLAPKENGVTYECNDKSFDTLGECIRFVGSDIFNQTLKNVFRPSDRDVCDKLLLSRIQSVNAKAVTYTDATELAPFESINFEDSVTLLISNRYSVRTGSFGNQTLVIKELLTTRDGSTCSAFERLSDYEWFTKITEDWRRVRHGTLLSIKGFYNHPLAFVTEYLPYGPLDRFLSEKEFELQMVDLIGASLSLAQALLYLNDTAKLVHGAIRCHNLLVADYKDNSLQIKLSDPFFEFEIQNFAPKNIQINSAFFAPELISKLKRHLELEESKQQQNQQSSFSLIAIFGSTNHQPAVEPSSSPSYLSHSQLLKLLTSFEGDVWAFGTTLWQIFNKGRKPILVSPSVGNDHENLTPIYDLCPKPSPKCCPDAIWELIRKKCWNPEYSERITPRLILIELNQTFHEIYNQHRGNDYTLLDETTMLKTPHRGASGKFPKIYSRLKNFVNNSGSSFVSTTSTMVTNGDFGYNCSTDTFLTDITRTLTPCPNNSSGSVLVNFEESNEEVLDTFVDTFDDKWIIDVRQLSSDKTTVLGQGFYGEVTKEKLTQFNGLIEEVVAVKRINKDNPNIPMDTSLTDMRREIEIMIKLRHKNIVEIKGFVEDPQMMLVMEYCDLGSMISYLKLHKHRNAEPILGTADLINFSLDITEGLIYLTNQSIVHRDLAARNVLVKASPDGGKPYAKISDFGLAQIIKDSEYYKMKTSRGLPYRWYAPESIANAKFSHASDIWSFGVTLWEIFSYGSDPVYKDPANPMVEVKDSELLDTLKKGIRLPCPADCPNGIYKLMHECWNEHAQERPKVGKIKEYLLSLNSHEN